MTRLRLTAIGAIATVLFMAGVAFAVNPRVVNRSTTGSSSVVAEIDQPGINPRVAGTLSALNFPGRARLNISSDNTGGFFYGSAQVRCANTGAIVADGVNGLDWNAEARCASGNGNAWAGIITIE